MPPLAVPQLGSCASSGRAWRLWAARHSQEEAGPLGASKAADLTACDRAGEPSSLDQADKERLQVNSHQPQLVN